MNVSQFGFFFDPNRCVQCHACEVACKSFHRAEAGLRRRRVISLWKGEYPAVVHRSVSMACMHCGEPACQAVCPKGAIEKRADGVVLVDKNKCIGCHACLWACPFGAVGFGSDGKMQKCDACLDLLEEGKEPACVATCPAEALHFGPLEKMAELPGAKAAQKYLEAVTSARR